MNVPGHYRKHRTVCVVDFTGADAAFIERAKRLRESVNGPNIKVDFVSVNNGVARSGFYPPTETPTGGDSDIQAWAESAGYTQVLLSRSGR